MLAIGIDSAEVAAALSRMVAELCLVAASQPLAAGLRRGLAAWHRDNVRVRCGKGTGGWPEHAPFDAILVPAGGWTMPQLLLVQLAAGGRLVMPVGIDPRSQQLVRIERINDDDFVEQVLHPPAPPMVPGPWEGRWML